SELIAIDEALRIIKMVTSPDEIWILCDSRSAIQHLSDWTNVGDKTSVCNTLVFGYHFDMAEKRILTQEEIDRCMNNSDELSEDGHEYSDDDVDFYLIVCHLMKIRIGTVKTI
ncbi:hypothetical protein TNCV_1140341, partial [Trichonephila clavipes]